MNKKIKTFTKKDYIIASIFVLVFLCIPYIGVFGVFALMSVIVYQACDSNKKHAFIYFISSFISFLAVTFLIAYFLLFSSMSEVVYPNVLMTNSEKYLYKSIVDECGYYDAETYDSYVSDDITIVILSGESHFIYASEGNDLKKVYLQALPSLTNYNDYQINYYDESSNLLDTYTLNLSSFINGKYEIPGVDSPIDYTINSNIYIEVLTNNEVIYKSKIIPTINVSVSNESPFYEFNSLKGMLKLIGSIDCGLIVFIIIGICYIIVYNNSKKKHI